jgi:hypothetical protein
MIVMRSQPGMWVSARVRRRRAAAVLVVLFAGIATWIMISPGTPAVPRRRALAPAPRAATPRGLAAAEAGLMPWHLSVAISRETAAAAPGNRLIVMGGLTAGGTSANGIYAVRTATGAARYLGALRAPGHDARPPWPAGTC